MANHTPGPWLVISGSPPCVRGSEGANIANDVPFLEDARLIAAAPDLLAALESNLEYLEMKAEGFARQYPSDHCINLTVMRQIDATHAAIRKAKRE